MQASTISSLAYGSVFSERELRRWLLSAAIVLAAHGALAGALVAWADDDELTDPVGAMVIELAALPVAPNNNQTDAQPGPEQVQQEASIERKAEKTDKPVDKAPDQTSKKEETKDIPERDKAEVVLNKEKPEPIPEKPAPSEAQLAAPVTTAPQMSKVDVAPVAAAPNQTQFNLVDSNAIPTWKRLVFRQIQKSRRDAKSFDKSRVEIEFRMDRAGRLRSSRIVSSSGSPVHDQEALDLIKRAGPFPAPPAAMAGEEVPLTIPIVFNQK